MRASLLAEAGQAARVLEVLLKQAEFDTEVVSGLIKELAKKEQTELQRGYGQIESRRRFKPHVSHPLLEQAPRSVLFIDESGELSSEPLPSRSSIFALGGIAMHEEAVDNYRVAADEVKLQFFNRKDFTFHEPQMRNRDGPYYFSGDEGRQAEFDEAIDRLVEEMDFVAFEVGVRKELFVETGVDPYLPTDVYALAIIMLLERYIDFLSSSTTKRLGRVIFESQGPLEDAYHQLKYARTLIDGSQWVPDSNFQSWLETGLRVHDEVRVRPNGVGRYDVARPLRMGPWRMRRNTKEVGSVEQESLLSWRRPYGQVRRKGVPRLGYPKARGVPSRSVRSRPIKPKKLSAPPREAKRR